MIEICALYLCIAALVAARAIHPQGDLRDALITIAWSLAAPILLIVAFAFWLCFVPPEDRHRRAIR